MSGGGDEDDIGSHYERRTDSDISLYRPQDQTGTMNELLTICKRFYSVFGDDPSLYETVEIEFPGFPFPTTDEFAVETNASSLDVRIRTSIIICWFLWKSARQWESVMKGNYKQTSSKCVKYYHRLSKLLSEFGWKKIQPRQGENRREYCLRRVLGYVNKLIALDEKSENSVLGLKA